MSFRRSAGPQRPCVCSIHLRRKVDGHGGRRPLTFTPDTGNVWDSGRRRRRRVRTDECTRLTAEQVYTDLLASDPARVHPGAYGWVQTVIEGVPRCFASRCARMRCGGTAGCSCGVRGAGRAARGCTCPTPRGGPACRRCWGLTYASRATRTYRDTPGGRGREAWMLFNTTQREWPYGETDRAWEARAEACAERWAYRRPFLQPSAPPRDPTAA